VIEVFVRRHLRRDFERVAPAGDSALRSESCVDARAAAAAVLLSLYLDELVGHVDDVDHLALFELSFED
jgi:hypothetical protein